MTKPTTKATFRHIDFVPLVKRRRRWQPWMTKTAWALGVVVVAILLVAAYYYPKARTVVRQARLVQHFAKEIPLDLSQQKFSQAKGHVANLKSALTDTATAFGKMQGLRLWPYVGRQYKAADQLLQVGQDSATALDSLVDFAAQIFSPFSEKGKVNLASISPAEKGVLLAGIAEKGPGLQSAREAIHQAATLLDAVPSYGLIGPLQKIVTPLKEQFPQIAKGLDQAIPATHILPTLLGYPKSKTYLFLLENNTELRPGGGFIGTYGLMNISSGEIASLKTDNVYNIDNAAKNLPVIDPPAQLQRYLKANAWYFRDANWSPDFPSSAEQALTLYQREGGQKNVDGVLAMTPTMLSALLGLVGPIKIDGVQFTSENFTDTLERYVELGYTGTGKNDSQRKDIIGPMTKELVDRILQMPISKWKDLFLVLSQQLNEKQFLIYSKDSATQGVLVTENWAGAVTATPAQDALMVVDANLASLKTDAVMERKYTYAVTVKDGHAEATLTIHYANHGKFDWKTTRYNTYVRVYVPNGSTLIDSHGAQIREKSDKAGEVTTTTELGRTVFGTFKSIEPGQQGELVLHYRIPDTAVASLSQGTYSLNWQKQPGMLSPNIQLSITTNGHHPTTVDGLDNQARLGQDSVSFTGTLPEDRDILVRY